MASFNHIMRLFFLLCLTFATNLFAQPVSIVTSFAILADISKNIGKDHVQVTALIKINTDPHSFKPTAKDIRALQNAKLVVINGLNFEPWMQRLLKAADYQGQVVVASDGIVPIKITEKVSDPHAWQEVNNTQQYVKNITQALIAIDSKHQADYQQQSQDYLQQLQQLDTWVKQQFINIPLAQRKVISSHQAFAYFGKAYGIQFYAPQGINDQARPSAGGVARLIRQMRQRHIKVLFAEHKANQRLLQQIAQETNAIIGGHLYSGSLTPQGGEADSYINLIKHNTTALKNSLSQIDKSK